MTLLDAAILVTIVVGTCFGLHGIVRLMDRRARHRDG